MSFFNLSRQAFFEVSKRGIFNRNAPVPEIVIANNAGILASFLARAHHGKDKHPNLQFIVPFHWLNKVLEDYYEEDWGQPIDGLPMHAQSLLLEVNPTYKNVPLSGWILFKYES